MKIISCSKTLIIQTAFIGDVILATPLIENLFEAGCNVDFLLRSGNQDLLAQHPKINRLWIWDKSKQKNKNLLRLAWQIRKQKYDCVFCLQRFASGGLLALASGSNKIFGFDKNPFSAFFHKKIKHLLDGRHEVERNLSLLEGDFEISVRRPKLYPKEFDYQKVDSYKKQRYTTISPASVWFTKQLPAKKWADFINALDFEGDIFLLGGRGDINFAREIVRQTDRKVEVLCGKLTLLQSAALMQGAVMNYVNDSAPMHLASSVNAPVCAVFCSTVPEFGFGPLSDVSKLVQIDEPLSCRPCGLHGHRACPKRHFDCANKIDIQHLVNAIHTS